MATLGRRQSATPDGTRDSRLTSVQIALLVCGVVAAVVSAAADLIASAARPGYNLASQSASVLTEPGAPTRTFVVGYNLTVGLLVIAFAIGLWLSAGRKRFLRVIAGVLVIAAMLQGVAVVLYPFHPGEPNSSPANTINVALMAPSVAGWFLAIALGAVAFKSWFRWFSVSLLVALFVEDFLTTAGASWFVAGGSAGSLVGIQERASGYGFYAWLALLSLVQVRAAGPDGAARVQRRSQTG